MKHNLRIAFLQLLPTGTQEGNKEKGLAACRKAKRLGADIALFPEMWNTGYEIPQEDEALFSAATTRDGAFVGAYGEIAKELDMAVCVTALLKQKGRPANSALLFDRHGALLYEYAKVHTCDFGEERVLDRGNDFPAAELDTAAGPVRVGSMICYDREFPESCRLLMLQGAELILVPNACPMEINRLSQLRGRAYENMLAIATCNYPAGQPDCNGHSSLFDGVAYVKGLRGSRDTCLLEATGEEDIYIADLDLDLLRNYRSTEVHGNAYRRPELYGPLTGTAVLPPFIRSDKRK